MNKLPHFQGEKGEKGDTGAKGIKGHTGLKGDQVNTLNIHQPECVGGSNFLPMVFYIVYRGQWDQLDQKEIR